VSTAEAVALGPVPVRLTVTCEGEELERAAWLYRVPVRGDYVHLGLDGMHEAAVTTVTHRLDGLPQIILEPLIAPLRDALREAGWR
jgi:hypothetical protein